MKDESIFLELHIDLTKKYLDDNSDLKSVDFINEEDIKVSEILRNSIELRNLGFTGFKIVKFKK